MIKKITKSGFTLIEILVAVAIIGVLATLVVANMQGARERARDVQRKSDLKQVKLALRLYYNDNQEYPEDNLSWGDPFGDNGMYMKKLPNDPLSVAPYESYLYTQNGDDDFYLVACLENPSDPDADESKDAHCSTANASYTVTAN